MITKPTAEELNRIDMLPFYERINHDDKKYLLMPAGQEHYRLLVWLSNHFEGGFSFCEIGTYRGLGSICLAYNASNSVASYDVNLNENAITEIPYNLHFIEWENKNTFDEKIIDYDLIFLDAWHDGIVEKKLYDFLVANDWKGILIMDDINHDNFPALRELWNSIEHPGKQDFTDIGHHSGTGVIDFSVE